MKDTQWNILGCSNQKYPKSEYCEYYHCCDKEISCRYEDFCPAYESTSAFSCLRFEEGPEEYTFNHH